MLYNDYLGKFTRPQKLRKIVNKAIQDLSSLKPNNFSIVVRGNSGLLVGVPTALTLNKNLVIIRKPGSHSNFPLEGFVSKNIVIVDDMVCSGNTLADIIITLKENCPKKDINILAIWLYNHNISKATMECILEEHNLLLDKTQVFTINNNFIL